MEETVSKSQCKVSFITKESKWYRVAHYDAENNICHIQETKFHRMASDDNTETFEAASKIHMIKIISPDLVMPDEYFLRGLTYEKVDLYRKVTDKRLINYLEEHKDVCEEATDKLKEIALSNEKEMVRKAAYETCEKLGLIDEEFLKEYQSYNRKVKKSEKKRSPIRLIENGKINQPSFEVRNFRENRPTYAIGGALVWKNQPKREKRYPVVETRKVKINKEGFVVREDVLAQSRELFKQTNELIPVALDANNVLVNGYEQYVIAVEEGHTTITYVPVKISQKEKQIRHKRNVKREKNIRRNARKAQRKKQQQNKK